MLVWDDEVKPSSTNANAAAAPRVSQRDQGPAADFVNTAPVAPIRYEPLGEKSYESSLPTPSSGDVDSVSMSSSPSTVRASSWSQLKLLARDCD